MRMFIEWCAFARWRRPGAEAKAAPAFFVICSENIVGPSAYDRTVRDEADVLYQNEINDMDIRASQQPPMNHHHHHHQHTERPREMDRPRSSVFVPSFHSHICLPTTNIARSNPMRVICATVGSIARKVPRHSSSRRHVLTALVPLVVLGVGAMNPRIASAAVGKPVRLLHQLAEIDPSLTPDATAYDATDERLRQAGRLIQQALNASTIEEEERMWTQIIDEFSDVDAVWRDDVVGRYGCCNSPLPRPSALSHPLARCLAVSLSRCLAHSHNVTLSRSHNVTLSHSRRSSGRTGTGEIVGQGRVKQRRR